MTKVTESAGSRGGRICQVTESYGRVAAARDLRLIFLEFVAVLGASGSAWTTDCCYSPASSHLRGRLLDSGPSIASVLSWRRNERIVFRSHVLFLHLNVQSHLEFSLKGNGRKVAERQLSGSQERRMTLRQRYRSLRPMNSPACSTQREFLPPNLFCKSEKQVKQ